MNARSVGDTAIDLALAGHMHKYGFDARGPRLRRATGRDATRSQAHGNGAYIAQLDTAGANRRELLASGVELKMGVRLSPRRIEEGLFVAVEAVASLSVLAGAQTVADLVAPAFFLFFFLSSERRALGLPVLRRTVQDAAALRRRHR